MAAEDPASVRIDLHLRRDEDLALPPPPPEPADSLRSEPDLRNEYDRAPTRGQLPPHRFQIHQGLAAAGDPEQEGRLSRIERRKWWRGRGLIRVSGPGGSGEAGNRRRVPKHFRARHAREPGLDQRP